MRHRRLQATSAILSTPSRVWRPRSAGPPAHVFHPQELSMPANRFNGFHRLRCGNRSAHPALPPHPSRKPVVDWFEIISENYMVDGGRPIDVLDRILEQYRVVQHGVSMYFGSAQPAEPRTSQAAQGTDPAHQNALALRSSLLGQRGRPLYARPAASALHL